MFSFSAFSKLRRAQPAHLLPYILCLLLGLLALGMLLSLPAHAASPRAASGFQVRGPSWVKPGKKIQLKFKLPRGTHAQSVQWSLDGSSGVGGVKKKFTYRTKIEGDYTFRCTVFSKEGPSYSGQITVVVAKKRRGPNSSNPPNPPGPPTPPQPAGILLNETNLAALRQSAAANTPEWQAFKATLDNGLLEIDLSQYQGSSLARISDYALGYQVLKTLNPRTAADYADKAIAILKSGLHDYQKGGWAVEQFLARGDGSTKTFTLPNADVIASTVHVYLAPVATSPIVRGAANGTDSVTYYSQFIKVSDSNDGSAKYLDGPDWVHRGVPGNNQINWAPGGKEPAVGATYYVTYASALGATNTPVQVSGHSITFTTAPRTDQAIFVAYIYGTHSDDGSTLAYQQTSANDGGFNSIYIDTGYSSRYLGKHVAMGLDWLDGYPGLSAAIRQETIDLLLAWSDYWRDQGYYRNYISSNYGAGGYVSRMFTALALEKRSAAGPRLIQEMTAYRQSAVIPQLLSTAPSLAGGFWAEGWNYGPLATQNVLLAGLAFENAGKGAATEERTWAGQAVLSLIHGQPATGVEFNGGDWYAYPAPFPGKQLFYVLAAATNDTTVRSYADHIIQTYPGSQSRDWLDFLLRKSDAGTSTWTGTQPLNYVNDGTGVFFSRADWSYTSPWLAFHVGNFVGADHQSASPGHVQLQRGVDDLIVNTNNVFENQDPHTKSSFSNLIAIDDNGEGAQNYRWNEGFWYGSPGVFVSAHEETTGYFYAASDYHNAYSLNTAPDQGGPASELTRDILYVRPDHLVVYDRATTTKASYPKRLQWHVLNSPTISGNAWRSTSGSSTIFGQTFSTVPIATTSTQLTGDGHTVYRIASLPQSAVASLRYITALQPASSATSQMDATAQILSGDNRMEGVSFGSVVALFPRNTHLSPWTGSLSYAYSSSSTTVHYITGVEPNRVFAVQLDAVSLGNIRASGAGVLIVPVNVTGSHTIGLS